MTTRGNIQQLSSKSAINYFVQNHKEVFESMTTYILNSGVFPDYIEVLKIEGDIHK